MGFGTIIISRLTPDWRTKLLRLRQTRKQSLRDKSSLGFNIEERDKKGGKTHHQEAEPKGKQATANRAKRAV